MLDVNSAQFQTLLDKILNDDINSAVKKDMTLGERYYMGLHDILDYRLFYYDAHGAQVEELNRSNIRIPHQFFTELVDQKVNYLLSNAIEFKTEDEKLAMRLEDYVTDEFQAIIKDLVEGASIKSYEALYFYYDDTNKLCLEVADSFNLIFITDDWGEVTQVIRHYITYFYDDKGNRVPKHRIELYDDTMVYYFVKADSKDGKYIQDKEAKFHRADDVDGTIIGREDSQIPFLILKNNNRLLSDLNPIKSLIDDYDLMAGSLSNNLVDFDYPIYAVKGFQGDDLDELITNLKTRKTIGVGENGGLDVMTVDIPVEARRAKLDLDRESIYKFGLGFDSTAQVSDRAITNLGIQSRYSLLDIKASKFETELRMFLSKVLQLILLNIEELYGETYDISDIEVVISRDVMVNDLELLEQDRVKAEGRRIEIETLMQASLLMDPEEVRSRLYELLEIEYDEQSGTTRLVDVLPLVGDDVETE